MMESPIPQPLPVPHQAWQSAGQRDHLQGGISPRLREEQQRNRFFWGISLMCCISTYINPYQSISTPCQGSRMVVVNGDFRPGILQTVFLGEVILGSPGGRTRISCLAEIKKGCNLVRLRQLLFESSGRPLNWQLLFEKNVEYLLSYRS